MADIKKGVINEIAPDLRHARILNKLEDNYITRPLVIPWYLREDLGALRVGDVVAYAEFLDFTGVIIDRMDSIGGEVFPWLVTSKVDFVSDTVSGKTHTHGGIEPGSGETAPPTGG